jgi:hypothetical protein
MRIGIFGDSFAAYYGVYTENKPWPILLNEMMGNGKAGQWARGGTSHWYSYEQFIKRYKKYDCIVFCHTNSMRWPVTPPGLEHYAWEIGFTGNSLMEPYNNVRKDILSEELLNYISLNIFKDVNRICQENNKYLVNIFSFPLDYDMPKTSYPALLKLNQVSIAEHIFYKGKYQRTGDVNTVRGGDLRDCHLNTLNNKRLADIVCDLIKNKTLDTIIDLTELEWDAKDPIMDYIYKKDDVKRI